MRFGQTIIAGTILSFTSAVELTANQWTNPWGTEDSLGVGIGMIDPDNEIGFYGAYQACVVDGKDHLTICSELQRLYDLHQELFDRNGTAALSV